MGNVAGIARRLELATSMRVVVQVMLLGCVITGSSAARAQMVSGSAIGNDPVRERLCMDRASASAGHGPFAPFEIDSRYVAVLRAQAPDATFVASDSGQLVECSLNAGRFGPVAFSPEQSFWHLIRPRQYEPRIGTAQGNAAAMEICVKSARQKIARPELNQQSYSGIYEAGIPPAKPRPGQLVDGQIPQRYDVVVHGIVYGNADGQRADFVCLLSPMLEFKALEVKAGK